MIHLHGYLGHISPVLRADCGRAALVVGTPAVLDVLGVSGPRRCELGPVTAAVEALRALPAEAEAVAVASGDPGFYGILRRLRTEGFDVRVTPAVSSVAAAYAAVALPWDDAVVVSAHGRSVDEALAAARAHGSVAVLTGPGSGLAELVDGLRDLPRTYVVAERLGAPDQRMRVLSAVEAAATTDIVDPYVVLVLDPANDLAPQLAAPVIPGRAAASDDEDTTEPGEWSALCVGQVTNSPAGRAHADAVDTALGLVSRRYDGPAVDGLPRAWAECDLVVSHLAVGATVRILAPLLADKRSDPGVVVVDEAGQYAIPVLGGHVGGANALARAVAEALGGTAAVSTATDALRVAGLDTLGWADEGDVAGVTRAVLDGRPVALERSQPWPLPPWPSTVAEGMAQPEARIVVTDEVAGEEDDLPTVWLHPKSLVVGMGCNRDTDVAELRALLEQGLAGSGLSRASVSALVSADVKAGEVGLLSLAHELGVPLRTFPSETLAAQSAPTPSDVVAGHVGTPSVAEAGVLASGAELLVPKQRSTNATVAVGRLPVRGQLSVVGLGPGARDLLTPRAARVIREASLVVGYAPYVRQIRHLVSPTAEVLASRMGTEEARITAAIDAARAGARVALVCGGDPAIYAMASPTLETGTEGIDVDVVPGVTASLAASAILGAPLGHDHVTISLSDLHTDWRRIEQRLQAAAAGDLVTVLYNPRSRTRTWQLPRALEILAGARPSTTPVAVVTQATRPQQRVVLSTLADLDPECVDMSSLVVIGSSTTRYVASGGGEMRMVTPRDYRWMEER